MTTREEKAAGINAAGEMNGVHFAKHIGAAHGTVKRWLHEGMPARREHKNIWIDPVAAKAWIDAKYQGRKPISIDRRSYLYVAQRLNDGAVKIGWTSDVIRRVAELRKLNASAVELAACLPGNKPDELRMHARFASYRIDGEWFAVELDDVLVALREAS